jgi:tRNA:m4X modification enzyme
MQEQTQVAFDRVNSPVSDGQQPSAQSAERRICKHICEKKKRQCKFTCLKDLEFCVEHVAFNEQSVQNAELRVVCPLDPKHSVYAKNFKKHLKKCNSRVKELGSFDVKDVNLKDEIDDSKHADINNNENYEELAVLGHNLKANLNEASSYKELSEPQLIECIKFILELDKMFRLFDLPFRKLENGFIEEILQNKNEYNKKHLKQISSIAGHLDCLLSAEEKKLGKEEENICLVELGAGRGKLSYWFMQARQLKRKSEEDKAKTEKCDRPLNILLIERGSQRYKFDTLMRLDAQEEKSEFERIRIDLKDLYINKAPTIIKSSKYFLYGKHLCGVATDYALRCLKHALEDSQQSQDGENVNVKCKGLVLAVCCHHQCVYESFCGKEFLSALGIDSKLFYILRSITSWSTCGDRYNVEQIKNGNKHFMLTYIFFINFLLEK